LRYQFEIGFLFNPWGLSDWALGSRLALRVLHWLGPGLRLDAGYTRSLGPEKEEGSNVQIWGNFLPLNLRAIYAWELAPFEVEAGVGFHLEFLWLQQQGHPPLFRLIPALVVGVNVTLALVGPLRFFVQADLLWNPTELLFGIEESQWNSTERNFHKKRNVYYEVKHLRLELLVGGAIAF